MFNLVNYMRSLVNYAIFGELCDRMRFEVDCAKSHHRVISEGLLKGTQQLYICIMSFKFVLVLNFISLLFLV